MPRSCLITLLLCLLVSIIHRWKIVDAQLTAIINDGSTVQGVRVVRGNEHLVSNLRHMSCEYCLSAGNQWCATTNRCELSGSVFHCPQFTDEERGFYYARGWGLVEHIITSPSNRMCTDVKGGEIWTFPLNTGRGKFFRSKGPNDLCWPKKCPPPVVVYRDGKGRGGSKQLNSQLRRKDDSGGWFGFGSGGNDQRDRRRRDRNDNFRGQRNRNYPNEWDDAYRYGLYSAGESNYKKGDGRGERHLTFAVALGATVGAVLAVI